MELISREAAIKALEKAGMVNYMATGDFHGIINALNVIKALPAAESEKRTEERTKTHACDSISRAAAIDKFIDGLEKIFADLRERHGDDSVCGLCEYDGAYIGQSGDWCNECPGFDKDDCFKLSDKIRKKWADEIVKALSSAQPEIIRCVDCKYFKVEHGWNCSSYPICEVSPQRIITPDDYCSFAERRTDENNNE